MYYFEPQQRITDKQSLSRIQVRVVIAKRTRSAQNGLYAVFFNFTGLVEQIPCKDDEIFKTSSAKKVLAAVKKNSIKINA